MTASEEPAGRHVWTALLVAVVGVIGLALLVLAAMGIPLLGGSGRTGTVVSPGHTPVPDPRRAAAGIGTAVVLLGFALHLIRVSRQDRIGPDPDILHSDLC